VVRRLQRLLFGSMVQGEVSSHRTDRGKILRVRERTGTMASEAQGVIAMGKVGNCLA